jgi:hypothetical protein
MEVLPSGRALAIAGIEESLLNLSLRIASQDSDNVIDSTLGDILRKCHPSVALERVAYICPVRKDQLGERIQTHLRIAPSFELIHNVKNLLPELIIYRSLRWLYSLCYSLGLSSLIFC